jgi:ubiquinone/menaquinone biosynthesis C-methylase UbiE
VDNKVRDIIEWDIAAWKVCLKYWDCVLDKYKSKSDLRGLEIGARNGGLTLYLSTKLDIEVYCSDLVNPKPAASELHSKYNLKNIHYLSADAKRLPFEDNYFDIVAFKSVLGAVGRDNNFSDQKEAMREIKRVLKKDGILLFAENAEASSVHKVLRKMFISWSDYWRYISFEEMQELLKIFNSYDLKSSGFLNVFLRSESMKNVFSPVDNLVCKIIPSDMKYILYGSAVK